MTFMFSGKKVLVVKGSLLAPRALEAALFEQGAQVVTATNLISAFSLVEHEDFDAAVIDKGLHNEAFDLCAELKSLGVPFLLAEAPHELQKALAQESSARAVAAALAERVHERQTAQEQFDASTVSACSPVAKGTASIGVVDPVRFS